MCVEAVKKTSKEEDLTDVCVCVHEESSMFQMLHFHISVYLSFSFLTFLRHVWLLTLCMTEPEPKSSGFTVDLIKKPEQSVTLLSHLAGRLQTRGPTRI